MLNINNIDNLARLEKSNNNKKKKRKIHSAPRLFGQCRSLVDKAFMLLIKMEALAGLAVLISI